MENIMFFFVTVESPTGRVSFGAQKLTADPGLPGNLIATGITDFPVKLPNGRVFYPSVWSFRAGELVSFMAGTLDDGVLPHLANLSRGATDSATASVPEAQAAVTPASEPATEPAAESGSADTAKPKVRRPRRARAQTPDSASNVEPPANTEEQLVLPGIAELNPANTSVLDMRDTDTDEPLAANDQTDATGDEESADTRAAA